MKHKTMSIMNADAQEKSKRSKRTLYVIVSVLAIASLSYRLLVTNDFVQSTLLFIGLPALMTVLVIKFSGTPRSTYGITFKVITLFLLMSGILLGEGIVCIIFAAPLFYGVAAIIISLNARLGHRNKTKIQALTILPLILIGSEIINHDQKAPLQIVSVSRVFQNDMTLDNLNTSPDITDGIPAFFNIGFPLPLSVKGTGTEVGDFRKIAFQSPTKDADTLYLEIIERTEDKIILEKIADDTRINQWLSWERIAITLTSNDDGTKTLEWETSFRCELNPRLYFEPFERYAVYESSNFLLDKYFGNKSTPLE